jgi:hypothetical protein
MLLELSDSVSAHFAWFLLELKEYSSKKVNTVTTSKGKIVNINGVYLSIIRK